MDHEETTTAEARGVRATFTITDDRYEADHEAHEPVEAFARQYHNDDPPGDIDRARERA